MKDIGVDHQMIKPSTKLWEIQIQSPFSSDWSISQSSVGWCRFFCGGYAVLSVQTTRSE